MILHAGIIIGLVLAIRYQADLLLVETVTTAASQAAPWSIIASSHLCEGSKDSSQRLPGACPSIDFLVSRSQSQGPFQGWFWSVWQALSEKL